MKLLSRIFLLLLLIVAAFYFVYLPIDAWRGAQSRGRNHALRSSKIAEDERSSIFGQMRVGLMCQEIPRGLVSLNEDLVDQYWSNSKILRSAFRDDGSIGSTDAYLFSTGKYIALFYSYKADGVYEFQDEMEEIALCRPEEQASRLDDLVSSDVIVWYLACRSEANEGKRGHEGTKAKWDR